MENPPETDNRFIFSWKIVNFSLCAQRNGEELRSPIFIINHFDETSWYLSLYPRGYQKSNKHVSCFLNKGKERGKVKNLSISTGNVSSKCEEFKKETHIKTNINELDVFDVIKKDLRRLYQEKLYTDVKLQTKKTVFPVHKSILAVRSPVFCKMFENSTDTVAVSDTDEILEMLLEFIYTGFVYITGYESVSKLIAAAHKYEIGSLKEKCATFLKCYLSVDTACEILTLAQSVKHNDLKSSSINYIKKHFNDLLFSSGWQKILKSHPELVSEVLAQILEELKTNASEIISKENKRGVNKKLSSSNIKNSASQVSFSSQVPPITSSAVATNTEVSFTLPTEESLRDVNKKFSSSNIKNSKTSTSSKFSFSPQIPPITTSAVAKNTKVCFTLPSDEIPKDANKKFSSVNIKNSETSTSSAFSFSPQITPFASKVSSTSTSMEVTNTLSSDKIISNPFLLAPPRLNLTKSSLFKAPATEANSSTGVTSSYFSRSDASNSKPFLPASSHLNSTVPLFNLSSSTTNTSVTFSSTTLPTSGSSVSWSRNDAFRVPSCKNNPFSRFGASNLDCEENKPLTTFYTSSNFSGSQTLNETKLPISSTPLVSFQYSSNKNEAAVICSDKTENTTTFPISSTPFVNFKFPTNENEAAVICNDKTEANHAPSKETFKDNSCDKTDSYMLDKEMLDLLQHDCASEETDSSSSVKEMK